MDNNFLAYLNTMKTQQSIDASPNPEATGVSDDVDAKLSIGEFVINAEQVSKLGGGATDPGFKFLEELVTLIDRMDRDSAVSFAENALLLGELLIEEQPDVREE